MKFIIGSHELNKMLIIVPRTDSAVCLLTDPDEEVYHEADVESQVDLLAGVLVVGNTVLHPFPAASNCQNTVPANNSGGTYAEASLKYTRRLTTDKTKTQKTRILPARVWPEMSSPAQFLASA